MTSTAALVEGHYLVTRSRSEAAPRGAGYVTHHEAACQCGHALNWDTRDEDHARHLLANAAGGADQAKPYLVEWATGNAPNWDFHETEDEARELMSADDRLFRLEWREVHS